MIEQPLAAASGRKDRSGGGRSGGLRRPRLFCASVFAQKDQTQPASGKPCRIGGIDRTLLNPNPYGVSTRFLWLRR